jgi:archaellum component FlaC
LIALTSSLQPLYIPSEEVPRSDGRHHQAPARGDEEARDRLDGSFTNLEGQVDAVGEHLKPIKEKAQEISELKREVDSSIVDLVSKVGAVENIVGKVNYVEDLQLQISNINAKIAHDVRLGSACDGYPSQTRGDYDISIYR